MITVLDIMKLYINYNVQKNVYRKSQFCSSMPILKYNLSIIKEINSLKNNHSSMIFPLNKQFKICESLLSKSLQNLTNLVNVMDVSTYVLLTNVYMSGKENFRKIYLYTGETFTVNIKINEEVLFYKSKRKDELVKFSFKFIRKQLINRHRKEISIHT